PGEEAVIQSLGANLRLLEGEVEEVELLGYGKLNFTRDERGLVVKMPNDAKRQPAYVLRIKVR
ncbi:MAG: alpha-L-fucosidase, partial [Caldivirga sp.]